MKLVEFFNIKDVIRDINIGATYYTNSEIKDTFTFALSDEFIHIANQNKNIAAIITTKELSNKVIDSKGLVISNNVKKDFFNLHNYLVFHHEMKYELKANSVSNLANISKTAHIGKNVFIGKNVEIGHFTVIEENCSIDDNTIIGDHVVIGARGLHNTRVSKDEFIHVFDAGGVKIGKNCEVLSGCVIQKSYFCEATIIEDFTKLGPLVNVGHGTKIGKRCLVTGGVVIAGFNEIGNDVWIGPSSTIAHGLKIGNNVGVKLGSVVITNLKDNENVSGNFAFSHNKHLINYTRNKRNK